MIKVIKRDCTEVPFDKNKIFKAIFNAMKYGVGFIDEDVALKISKEIEDEVINKIIQNSTSL